MSTSSSSVSLVFESREELGKFLNRINAAHIKVDDNATQPSWLQWGTIDGGQDSLQLYEYGVVEGVEEQLIMQDSDL